MPVLALVVTALALLSQARASVLNDLNWTAIARDVIRLESLADCDLRSLCRFRYPLDDGKWTDVSKLLAVQPLEEWEWNTTAVLQSPTEKNESSVVVQSSKSKKKSSLILCNMYSCRCDPDCGQYGDCCLDASYKYGLDDDDDRLGLWSCLPLAINEAGTVTFEKSVSH